ncbi:Late Golgi vesicles protein [Agyrium rufum]|nr:Late Golgi vesicles protein [Agyrium rufum]
MDLANGFRIANLAVGVFMVLGGITRFSGGFFNDFIIGAYVIIFGLANIGLEFQIPPYIARYASFYFSFLGRGIFYIFVGSIILTVGWASKTAGTLVGVAGIVYAVLEFVPSIEPPSNMREADQGWGAEQV